MPNTNESLFIVIFSLIAIIVVLLTYVCWLKRMKMRAKKDILSEQHRLEHNQQQRELNQALSASQLQQMKPALLQQLFAQDIQRQRAEQMQRPTENPFEDTPQYTQDAHILVNIHDSSETDATIIHTGQETNVNGANSRR
ncbi:uncharacterized protein B0P05DRAFT_570682 [Gilbertella persicaria]|uniref:Uncharacterized protein n=1 Tax=Rhizopus stolonifer TaxID=4846 RepID=A0A367IIT8_RHIST|nr:uncharacterized protein B0P05DRAFT_570682 [Gilbertella persicaria]KAI8083353.1 hypothetical protein B0P05DRAFT_570682 [Gilbertella persicaria]RCH77577.1 hypothetical protein CU098_003830 [Rhizopus stolonifer]